MTHNVLRASLAGAALLLLLSGHPANAQETHDTAFDRQMHHVDFSVSGNGMFTTTATGTNFAGTTATQTPIQLSVKPSNTLGALLSLRYTISPWVGFEGNYDYARYTENFSAFVVPQTDANEYSFGYVVHPGALFGLKSFISAGSGTIAFRPTLGGGLHLLHQGRQVYYYDAGVENTLPNSNFGFRLEFRQSYFLAPDFGQNYLTIKQHVISTEPALGIIYHF